MHHLLLPSNMTASIQYNTNFSGPTFQDYTIALSVYSDHGPGCITLDLLAVLEAMALGA